MQSRNRNRRPNARTTRLRCEVLEERRLLAAIPAPGGLIGWWTGDGNALDAAGSHNGILESGVGFAPGKVGLAFSLDGINDRVRIPNSPDLNAVQGFTIEGWIKSNDTDGLHAIASKWNDSSNDNSYIFRDHNFGNTLRGEVDVSESIRAVVGATTITVGQWAHVAFAYDTHSLKLYFNGSLDATLDVDPSLLISASANDLLIGATGIGSGVGENFSGLIDELSLYNRALSATEIQSIYQAGSDGKIKTSAMTVVSSTPAMRAIVDGTPSDFAIDFSFAYDVSSVQASDLTVNGLPADSFIASDPDTITFHFNNSPVRIAGEQTVAMGSGVVTTGVVGVGNPAVRAWTTTFKARLTSSTFSAQLVDLFPGAEQSISSGYEVVNGAAFFHASDGITHSLWKTDGTAAGTAKVSTAPDNIQFGDMINVNGTLFFMVRPSDAGPFQLWKSDGTAAGTVVVDSSIGTLTILQPFILGSVGGDVFYVKRDLTLGDQLWRSDGTSAGTILLSDVNPGGRPVKHDDIVVHIGVISNNRLFFVADDGTHGYEVWISDGTPQGTSIVFDLNPGSGWGARFAPFTAPLLALNGFAYFLGRDGDSSVGHGGLWKTDGTVGGTSLVKEAATMTSVSPIASLLGKLYFMADGGLWVTDGTTNGLALLKTLSVTSPPVQAGQNVFFAADDGVHGNALWKTDGTPAGTVMVRAITGSSSAGIGSLTNVNGKLFFTADDALSGNELWESDGTEVGTILAMDVNPGPNSSSPGNLRSVNNHLVFTADDGVHGNELWVATSSNNALPLARSSQVTAVQETALPITLFASDFDNDPLSYGVIDQPQHGTLSGTVPNLTYTAANNYTGPDSFTFRASDGKAISNLATISITVISNKPVANGQNTKTKHDRLVDIVLSGSDPRGLPLTYAVVATPQHGTLSGTAPNLTYTPALGYIGPDSFTFQADNGQSTSNTATISIDVTPNHAPVVSDETFLIFATANITLSELAGDEDGDPLTYTVLSQPDHGTLSGTPPNLTYTPVASVNPTVTFTYQASDSEAVSNVGTITLLIISAKLRVNAEDGAHTEPDWAHTIFPDVPPGGDPSVLFKPIAINTSLFTTQPEIDSTGRLTFTPAPNSQGTTRVSVTKSTAPAGGEGETASGDETADFLIEIDQKAPWQNDNNDDDVDNDGNVAPIDGLLVIDYLNGIGSGGITSWSSEGPFFDTSGDNIVSPEDALLVINVVNAGIFDGPLLAEGESTITSSGCLGLPAGPPRSSDATPAGPPPTLLTIPTPTTTDSDLLNLLALDAIQATSQRRRA